MRVDRRETQLGVEYLYSTLTVSLTFDTDSLIRSKDDYFLAIFNAVRFVLEPKLLVTFFQMVTYFRLAGESDAF